MKRILKPEVYLEKSSIENLLKIDMSKRQCFVAAEDLDLYNSAKDGLRQSHVKITSSQMVKFKEQCLVFFKAVVGKILERSPLKYRITKALSCLSPKVMLSEMSMQRLAGDSMWTNATARGSSLPYASRRSRVVGSATTAMRGT